MPPSFLIDQYKIENIAQHRGDFASKGHKVNGVLTSGELILSINWELVRKVISGWEVNEPKRAQSYKEWPIRFSFTCKSGRENDRKLKLLKWPIFRDEIVRLFGRKWDSDAMFMAKGWVKTVRDNFAYDDWTKTYVNEHGYAHPVRGISWEQLLKFGMMNDLYEFTGDFTGWWYDEFDMPGDFSLSQSTISFGIRGRSPMVEFRPYQQFIMERARQIGFNPGPSTVNAFCKHIYMMRYMRSVFDEFEQKLGCRIISPKTEGGRIYTELRNAYLEGKVLTNYDVAGMELITPTIIAGDIHQLPPGIGCCVSYLEDIPELLSGVGPTSDWDIIAHLTLLEKIIDKTPELICVLGDDGTIVGGKIKNSHLYERQYEDERIHRTLGLTTTEYMHPVGLNITIDNAKHSLQVIPDQWIRNKLTFEERDSIADLFLGNVNGIPLHEIIGKMEPDPFEFSPKEMISKGFSVGSY